MYYAPGSFGTACGLADGGQGGPQLVGWPEVAQCPVGQLPDQALAVGHHALGVVLVQLGHDHVQTVDKHLRRDLKKEEDGRIISRMTTTSSSLLLLHHHFFLFANVVDVK